MNNGHLPAGRAGLGAGAGQGMADMSGGGFGGPQGNNGGGGGANGHNGHNGHNNGLNGHNGYHNNHNGHHGGRGGGPRRGGRYHGNNYNHNNQHHSGHHGGYSNQHGGQYQQQMFQQPYMQPYGGQQYGYQPMPYIHNPPYMQFQQPQQQYGRPSIPGAFASMGMHMTAQPGVLPHQQQPPPPQGQQHAPLTPLTQHAQGLPHNMQQPPHVSPYAPNVQNVPLVVSTQQAQQQLPPQYPLHGMIPPHQQDPSAGIASFQPPPPIQTSVGGLPSSLPPHIPIPPRGDVPHNGANPYGAAENFPPAPLNPIPTQSTSTPMSAISNQPNPPSTIQGTITPSTDAGPTPTSEADQASPQASFETPSTVQATPKNATPAVAQAPEPRKRFLAPLPWLSMPDEAFPPRRTTARRNRRDMGGFENVELPSSQYDTSTTTTAAPAAPTATPKTPKPAPASTSATTPTPVKASVTSPTVPAVPVIPALPVRPAASKPTTDGAVADGAATEAAEHTKEGEAAPVDGEAAATNGEAAQPAAAPAPSGPKLWTGLFSKVAAAANAGANGADATNGHAANGTNGTAGAFTKSNVNSLAEAVSSYRVGTADKVAFIEPRGLINTGNMCYMNSVLQVLTFCIPFYDFLDQVGQKAAFSFKSETPMIDAMIMFLREFKVIDRADPTALQKRLKSDDLERFGDAFTPEFVYNAIKQLPRFSSMIRGHQQDAEEFLGFLLESLNEECAKVMQDAANAANTNGSSPTSAHATPALSVTSETGDASGGWLEVGPRQRAAETRSSGHAVTSPINSIFSGLLRSELRVPGRKDSVTLEPYQSLQLHIDSPEVRNIVDALRNLTIPETLHADFKSPQGKDVSATKQVYIEDLPPVLILHLKRFQFDWQGNGTVKIWKKIGYPLELEIPREIFSRLKRNTFVTEKLPRYRLNAVVYHHGKQASGGHYTVDALREDGREWIRLDDTVIRRIRREEVAQGGAEESGAVSATPSSTPSTTAAPKSTSSTPTPANRFAGMGDGDAGDSDNDWSAPVNGNGKKWSSVANGATSPKNKVPKENIKDNKVAYLLFYQRIN
ncbi:hypothetical protein Sste5346_001188 [Sporothrix stenoceras]|uniref:ubiquitinyl hydrolase 1 n=1 Tax=Sporothrix stenoceras TaxID=5173 RepID=A0ABR3ZRN6_9PEZI